MSQSVFTFIVTQNCQLACKYCYLVGKNSLEKMQFSTARQIIDCILADNRISSTEGVVFDFIGGEPLLEIELINNIMDYLSEKVVQTNHKWKDSYTIRITTNGLLYDNIAVQQFICKYKDKLTINISIDGTKLKNDSNRIFPDGKGSYDSIIDNVKLWVNQFPNASTNMVISHNDLPLVNDSLRHLVNLGIKSIEVNPVEQNVWKENDDKIFEEQLIGFVDYIIETHLWEDINISFLLNPIGVQVPFKTIATPCGDMVLSVDARGNFYSCLRFAKYSLSNRKPLIVGNIHTGILHNRLRPLMLLYRDIISPECCKECEINAGCKLCPADSYDDSINGSLYIRTIYACKMNKAKVKARNYFNNKLKMLRYNND